MQSCWTSLAWGEVTEAANNSLVSGPLGCVKFSRVPESSGCCRAVLVDMPLQSHILGGVSGLPCGRSQLAGGLQFGLRFSTLVFADDAVRLASAHLQLALQQFTAKWK